MPHIRDKSHVVQRLNTERRRLENTLSLLALGDMLQPGVVRHWSVKDVLAHLYDWEARFPVWLEAARHGAPPDCPDPHFTWRQVHQLNAQIFLAHQDEPLEEVLANFRAAHLHFMQAVESLSDTELFTPSYYPFTEKACIFDWLHGFANHDLWGKTKIRQWRKPKGR
jgi:hypothetical protein